MDALRGKIAKIVITRHAVERLLERKPREYRKISGEVIANIVGNIVCSGKYLERTDEEESAEEGVGNSVKSGARSVSKNIRFSTRKYTVCCRSEGDKLVVTTVINTEEMTDAYKKALKYAKYSPFERVIVLNPTKQIERWVRKWSEGRDMGGQAVQEQS